MSCWKKVKEIEMHEYYDMLLFDMKMIIKMKHGVYEDHMVFKIMV